MDITVKRFDKELPLPDYEPGAACFDFTCRETVTLAPREIKLVPTNIAVKVPEGYALMVYARNSTPMRKGLVLANSVGIVDPFYCGDQDEVLIEFLNILDKPVTVNRGDTLAQGMFVQVEPVSWSEVDTMGEPGRGGYSTDWEKE